MDEDGGATTRFLLSSDASSDVDGTCTALNACLRVAPSRLVVCDCAAVSADLVAIEMLARLLLAARRRGSTIRLARASDALMSLVTTVGLDSVLLRA
jgi:hypothetical protein